MQIIPLTDIIRNETILQETDESCTLIRKKKQIHIVMICFPCYEKNETWKFSDNGQTWWKRANPRQQYKYPDISWPFLSLKKTTTKNTAWGWWSFEMAKYRPSTLIGMTHNDDREGGPTKTKDPRARFKMCGRCPPPPLYNPLLVVCRVTCAAVDVIFIKL